VASKRNVTIALTGGLGNQLFQLAAALSYAQSETVQILTQQGKPRKNVAGQPELLSFSLPTNVRIIDGGYFKWLSSKIIGFNLRSGFNPKKSELGLLPLIQSISKVVLFALTGHRWELAVADNIGRPTKLKLERNTLLIGYFQTDAYIQDIGVENFVCGLATRNPVVEEHRKLSELEQPLVVHVRLGDYKNENSIGVVRPEYYFENSKKLFSSGKYRSIWLFSDEPDEAIKLIEPELLDKVRVIDSRDLSSAETLELMTFGKGYLIANSTFGWWGAYLSKSSNPDVTAPTPWFKKLSEPRELVPVGWNRAQGFDLLE
jgi:rhodanese-related sulfurtransferase